MASQKIRAAIIDDEPIARERVIGYLQTDPEIRIVGEAGRGRAAMELLSRKRPDLIFLDIKMPDLNGFEVINKLDPNYTPYIVFITAYDRYAIKAFDVNVVDYLLKPYDKDRFLQSLVKAKQRIMHSKSSELSRKIMHLVKAHQQHEMPFLETIVIEEKGIFTYIDVDDIQFISSNGNYVSLQLDVQQYLYRETMNALESKLDPSNFLRIHRFSMVNINYLRGIKYLGKNEYEFQLQNSIKIVSGRSYAEQIRLYLSDEAKVS